MKDWWVAFVDWLLHRKRSNDCLTVIAPNSIIVITIHKD